jgi:hypothetical protein
MVLLRTCVDGVVQGTIDKECGDVEIRRPEVLSSRQYSSGLKLEL